MSTKWLKSQNLLYTLALVFHCIRSEIDLICFPKWASHLPSYLPVWLFPLPMFKNRLFNLWAFRAGESLQGSHSPNPGLQMATAEQACGRWGTGVMALSSVPGETCQSWGLPQKGLTLGTVFLLWSVRTSSFFMLEVRKQWFLNAALWTVSDVSQEMKHW